MANITISNLHPVGSELFSDSESYLSQLSEGDLEILGGFFRGLTAPHSALARAIDAASLLLRHQAPIVSQPISYLI
jgi:hypothetical protein